MIEAKHVSKWFDGQQVLYDINATFDTGKTNLIIGQSGSGKTVFMKCLIGLMTPEEGEILYDGRKIRNMNTAQRRQIRTEIGMLFQGSALFDNETVLGNVMFPLKMFSPLSHKEQLERAYFCIRRVGLENADNKYPSEISGGMQKRVAIARAIALNPKYLFCDEPNSGLDPKTSILIDELLSDITHE
ncbi:MAG: ATP-binding cassette domain-containing protein, partial [Muribaculaceae bacterium]|nr:ATP-binding cassette domain-containing protein [Muribaculaceae bacterium]